jgi:hypothetical protein
MLIIPIQQITTLHFKTSVIKSGIRNDLLNVKNSMKRKLPQLATETLMKLCGHDPQRVKSRQIPVSGIFQA